MGDLVKVSFEEDVLVVSMANAARSNVFDIPMTEQLAGAFRSGHDAGAIVLLAEGANFSLGGDLSAVAAAQDRREYLSALASSFHEVIRAMRATPAPIVVGLHGWAAGAGMSMVLAADMVVAGASAKLRPAYTGIGLTPDGGMTWTLPRIVGHRRARAILLGNQMLTAAWAQEIGIVDDIVADEVVDQQAIAFGHRLADGASNAYAGVKRLLQGSSERRLDEQLDLEAESIVAAVAGVEAREGIDAFLERRPPEFRVARARAGE